MKTFKNIALSAQLLLLLVTLNIFAENVSSTSLYQLDITLEDQNGKQISFDVFQGQPVLVAMFYANCPHVCPLTIHNLKKTEARIEPTLREQLRVLLVSLDTENDTPTALLELARNQQINLQQWKLVRANASDTKKLAAVLGVRFRALPDGEFNHSTLVTLLDSSGEVKAQSSELAKVDEIFLEKIINQLKAESFDRELLVQHDY